MYRRIPRKFYERRGFFPIYTARKIWSAGADMMNLSGTKGRKPAICRLSCPMFL